jgi:hypothetical protein
VAAGALHLHIAAFVDRVSFPQTGDVRTRGGARSGPGERFLLRSDRTRLGSKQEQHQNEPQNPWVHAYAPARR